MDKHTENHTDDALTYHAPMVRSLGSVQERTAKLNKIGSVSDKFTKLTGISGVIVPKK